MTNADCIRRMSDEQLYEFLSEWECGDIDYSITFCDLCKQGGNELNLDCDGCRKHWLQRDAVDFGGLMYWKRNATFTADAPQTDVPRCSINGTPFDECGFCEHFNCDTCQCEADTPQTDVYDYKGHGKWERSEYRMGGIKSILTANDEGTKVEELAVTLDIFISSGLCLPVEIYDKAKDLRDELIRYAERIS